MTMNMTELRAELASPDLDATERDCLLVVHMRRVLADARKARTWLGGREQAIDLLHAAGFRARECVDLVDDALLLLEADCAVTGILADAAKIVAGAALALAWWVITPGDAGARELEDMICPVRDWAFESGLGIGMIATAAVVLFAMWVTERRNEPVVEEASIDSSWGDR